MTLKRVCTGIVAIAALASSSAALAADPVRAGSALPASAAVTTNHLPSRTLKPMSRKEHLQGDEAAAASGGTNWVVPVLAIAAIGGGVAAAVSNSDSKPDSP
jgi:hypothetical protein